MEYKLLGHSGVRVSELCLGTMTFGENWGWGASKEESRRIFEAFIAAGGNFLDTSCNYTDGTSEKFIGEFIQGQRERLVIASKYSLTMRKDDPNGGGNSRKNMMQTVEGSLKRLQTDYLDLLYLHMWDYTTPIEEVMRGFDDLVRQGKVLYVAFSDSPAWVVSRAVTLAEQRGWARPVGVQIPYSLASRDVEREVLTMARHLDLAILPWGLIGGGVLTGKYNTESGEPRRYEGTSDRAKNIAAELGKLAAEVGRSPAQVAINWVRQQLGTVIPILGARTLKQMQDNLGCLEFSLTDEQMSRLSTLAGFSRGFPDNFLEDDEVHELIFGTSYDHVMNHHRR
jgi:aryl-alcohol dehydrogenase-like predicted oxidoreductase